MTYDVKKGRLILLFLLLFLTGCDLSPGGKMIEQTESQKQLDESAPEEKMADAEGQIWVHVCGEVKNPGVYCISAGSRVFDAIEAAGGFTKNADENSLNLALTLEDEGKIQVGSKKKKGTTDDDGNVTDSEGKVNLNTATLEDLMTLPGIGEKRAQSILYLREQKGSFQKIEELLEAEGIKDGIFQKIKDLITV